MVGILPSSAMGEGSISSLGARIPHVSWPRNEGIKKKNEGNVVASSMGTLKMVHIKKSFKINLKNDL